MVNKECLEQINIPIWGHLIVYAKVIIQCDLILKVKVGVIQVSYYFVDFCLRWQGKYYVINIDYEDGIVSEEESVINH